MKNRILQRSYFREVDGVHSQYEVRMYYKHLRLCMTYKKDGSMTIHQMTNKFPSETGLEAAIDCIHNLRTGEGFSSTLITKYRPPHGSAFESDVDELIEIEMELE